MFNQNRGTAYLNTNKKMTFEEYINQKNAQRQPPGSVKVRRSDCEYIHGTKPFATLVKLKHFGYVYILGNEGYLYTINEDESKGRLSVFKLID